MLYLLLMIHLLPIGINCAGDNEIDDHYNYSGQTKRGYFEKGRNRGPGPGRPGRVMMDWEV